MSAPAEQPAAEERGQNLDADLVIANLSDRIGRDARTIAVLQAALAAKEKEITDLRGELVKATGGEGKAAAKRAP